MSHKPQPFGHLGLYFHDTATTSSASGYYQALRPEVAPAGTLDAADIGDSDAMFIVREFADLFVVGEV